MHDQGHADGLVGVQVEERDQADLAEVIVSAGHAGRRDGGPDHGHEHVGDDEKVRDADAEGEHQDPVIEDDAQPDDKGQERVHDEVAGGVEELQAVDELAGEP